MEPLEAGSIQLELKYCERCGALWLRPKGSDLVFCSSCALVMAGLAPTSRFLNQRYAQSQESAYWSEGGDAGQKPLLCCQTACISRTRFCH
jgi:hypothetical protein